MDADLGGPWRPGQVIEDRYEVREVVRTGGMGLVYRVRHRGWDIDLAVKEPRRELVGSAGGLRGFEAEAESWVGLGAHPNTVSCVYVRRMAGLPRVFAEWVDGGDLATAVRGRRLYRGGLARVLDIAIQTAWGLAHAHANGLVHQDVKPANVLLGLDGAVKVTDFGLAKARAAAGESPVPPPGGSLLVSYGGLTPAYCSPEQARAAAGGQAAITRATDVWSWAVTVLSLFTGGPPTRYGQAAAAAFEQYLASGPEPGLPVMPTEVAELLRRCLRVDPAVRTVRMADLARELVEIYGKVLGPYPRKQPEAATLLADGLSNQALSMLDLGYPDRAEALWDKALLADPRHQHARYNRGLRRWRDGLITDTRLLAELDGVDEQLLAEVRRERGAAARAVSLAGPGAVDSLALSGNGLLAVGGRAGADEVAGSGQAGAGEAAGSGRPGAGEAAGSGRAGAGEAAGGGRADAGEAAGGGRADAGEAAGGVVRVWDLDAGVLRRECAVPGRGVRAVALSLGGEVLAAGTDETDGTVWRWDLRSGENRCWVAHSGRVTALALSPDGRWVVSAGVDGAVLVWSAAGELAHTLEQPSPSRRYSRAVLAISADGRLVFRWDSATGRLRTWELASGQLVRSRPLRAGHVVFSGDGRTALALGEDVSVWRLATGELVRRLDRRDGWTEVLAVSGDGRRALAGGNETRIWDLVAGRCVRTLTDGADDPGWTSAAVLSADGAVGAVATGSTVRCWTLSAAGPPASWSYPRPRAAVDLSTAEAAVRAALARAESLAQQEEWPRAAAEIRTALGLPGYERNRDLLDRLGELGRYGQPSGLLGAREIWQGRSRGGFAMSEDGRTVVLQPDSSSGYVAEVWDPVAGELRHQLSGHGDPVRAVALDPQGQLAVTASEDRRIRLWDLGTGRRTGELAGHDGEVWTVALSQDRRRVVSAGQDRTVRLWDLATGRGRVLAGPSTAVTRVGFSPDGALVFAADPGGMLWIWTATGERHAVLGGAIERPSEVAFGRRGRFGLISGPVRSALSFVPGTGEYQGVVGGHEVTVTALAISEDEGTGYSADEQGVIQVFEAATERVLSTWTGHTGEVGCLLPHGRLLFSGGADDTVRVWNPVAGQCLGELSGRSVALSRDGRVALTAGPGETLRSWLLDWDYEFPVTE